MLAGTLNNEIINNGSYSIHSDSKIEREKDGMRTAQKKIDHDVRKKCVCVWGGGIEGRRVSTT